MENIKCNSYVEPVCNSAKEHSSHFIFISTITSAVISYADVHCCDVQSQIRKMVHLGKKLKLEY